MRGPFIVDLEAWSVRTLTIPQERRMLFARFRWSSDERYLSMERGMPGTRLHLSYVDLETNEYRVVTREALAGPEYGVGVTMCQNGSWVQDEPVLIYACRTWERDRSVSQIMRYDVRTDAEEVLAEVPGKIWEVQYDSEQRALLYFKQRGASFAYLNLDSRVETVITEDGRQREGLSWLRSETSEPPSGRSPAPGSRPDR
jgi:hypothetical protein